MIDFFNAVRENAVKLVSSLRWNDFLDIFAVALVLYYCIKLFRQTRATHLVKGFIFLGVGYLIVSALNMSTASFLFSRLFNDIVIVIILLFQPEFRHAIESFGRGDFKKITIFSRGSSIEREEKRTAVSAIVKAASNMSESKTGALIVFEGKSPLGEIISTGSEIDAKISVPIIENIFYPKSPLHDGAMIIRDNRICAAGCILPLTQSALSRELGTRHRAAVGMSEASDALVLVVSEETGAISVARGGTLKRKLTNGELLEILSEFVIGSEEEKPAKIKNRRRKSDEKD
ncbi:MAG: diadenylate cyclase CdaA [Clostridia bacterium]|nr:diadenylate cyclase CdaA [Clostridia bacterium]